MVIKGDVLSQVMGDWAKGEFKNANKGSAWIISRPLPGMDGAALENTTTSASLQVADRQAAQTASADTTMNPRR